MKHCSYINESRGLDKGKVYLWVPLILLLFPTLPATIGFGNQLVFIIQCCILLFFQVRGVFNVKFSGCSLFYFVYFLLATLFDIIIDSISGDTAPNDFLEPMRVFGILLVYQFYRYSNLKTEFVEFWAIRLVNVFFILIGIYCIAEFLLPDVVRPISYILWKRPDVPILKNKAIGSFFQTYNYAYALLIPFIYGLLRFINKWTLGNLSFFVLMLLNLLLTQSRSMYLCAGMGVVLCFLLPCNYDTSIKKLRSITLIIILVLSGVALFLVFESFLRENLGYAFSGLEAISDGQSTSVASRQSQINWALDNNYIGIIGFGIGKSVILLESVYALYYYRYGVFGLLLLFSLVLNLSYCAFRIARHMIGNKAFFYYTLSVFYILSPLALSSSCHHDMPKTVFFFYGFAGLVFKRYKEVTNVNEKIVSACKPCR